MIRNKDLGEWHDWRKESPTRDMEGQTMLVSNGTSYALCDWCEGGCWAENPFNGFRFNDEILYWAELPDIPRG